VQDTKQHLVLIHANSVCTTCILFFLLFHITTLDIKLSSVMPHLIFGDQEVIFQDGVNLNKDDGDGKPNLSPLELFLYDGCPFKNTILSANLPSSEGNRHLFYTNG